MASDALDLVVWDLDGTLVDSRSLIVSTMTEAFQQAGLTPPSEQKTADIIGLTLAEGIERLLPDGEKHRTEAVTAAYRQAYFAARARPDFTESLFPGIAALLDRLTDRGVPMAVATGKSRRGLMSFLEAFGYQNRFVCTRTPDDGPGKPDPWMIREAMDAVCADAGRTVMIGDATYDMEMAVRAGVIGLGVSWGNHSPEALKRAGAYVVAGNTAGLEALLEATPWTGRYRPVHG